MWLKIMVVLLLTTLFCFGVFLCQLQLEREDGDIFHAPRPLVSLNLAKPKPKPKKTPGATRIPQQLVLTSKDGSLAKLTPPVQANVRHTLDLNPWFTIRWLGDDDCQRYLVDHYNGTELPLIFQRESRGSYRSDICRAAVLAKEGGFYTDLDVEMKATFDELAGNETTFLAAYSEDGSVLNAMLGAAPGCAFMKEVLRQITLYYRGDPPPEQLETTAEWMGPITAYGALKAVAHRDCPEVDLQLQTWEDSQRTCGPHVVRMFQERSLECWQPGGEECPLARYENDFAGVKYGIFDASGSVVSWPRFAQCKDWGCQTGGWETGEETPQPPDAAKPADSFWMLP